jgi:hypothetical protein
MKTTKETEPSPTDGPKTIPYAVAFEIALKEGAYWNRDVEDEDDFHLGLALGGSSAAANIMSGLALGSYQPKSDDVECEKPVDGVVQFSALERLNRENQKLRERIKQLEAQTLIDSTELKLMDRVKADFERISAERAAETADANKWNAIASEWRLCAAKLYQVVQTELAGTTPSVERVRATVQFSHLTNATHEPLQPASVPAA